MRRSVQILAAAAVAASGTVAADSTFVTSLLLPFDDPNHFVATILGVDQDATTFAYTCGSDVAPTDCGLDTPGIVIQGPSTWQISLSQSDDEDGLYSLTANCVLTPSKNEANCVVSATQSDGTSNSASTTSGVTTSYLSDVQAVTVIAGFDKLSGGAVPSQTTASSTTAASPSSSGTQSTSQTPAASSSTSAAASSTSKTASPNAAPAVTQQALLAGVAAFVGALVL